MERDEISLKTKTKVSISLGGKEITSATNAQIRNAAYARKQKRVTTATATKTPPNEKLNECGKMALQVRLESSCIS